MSKEVETITKEFEKLVEENREKVLEDMKKKQSPAAQVNPPNVKCSAGEVCHGGDLKPHP